MKEFKNIKILDFDVPTKTGKIYTKECILNALDDRVLKERLDTKSMFGFFDVSDTNIMNAALVVTSLKIRGNSLYADIKLLNTPQGGIAERLLNQGMPLTLGLRGQGTMNGNKVEHIDIYSVDLITSNLSNNIVCLSTRYELI